MNSPKVRETQIPGIYKPLRQFIIFFLLVLSYGFLSYNFFPGWWYSSLGTLAIIYLSYLLWNDDFTERTGLKIKYTVVIKSLLLAILLTLAALGVMKYIAAQNEVSIKFTNWRNYYHDIFYVLNEEIVLGAVPLWFMVKKWKMNPVVASLTLAILFSIVHFIFYKWIFLDRGTIQITTLLTLFFVGIIRNNLIIQTGHIGYSWALHFSWMAVMFGSAHVNPSKDEWLTEPERFNTYLGSYGMLAISALIVILSLIIIKRKGHSWEN